MWRSAASTLTVASTGPAHGTKTRPRLTPSTKPPPRSPLGRRLSRASGASISIPNRGTSNVAATTNRSAIATSRSVSCGSPSAERSAEAERVKTVKLTTSPATIAYGRRRPPAAPPASTIGSTGSTHGETAVITPATKPIPSSSSTSDSSVELTSRRRRRLLRSPSASCRYSTRPETPTPTRRRRARPVAQPAVEQPAGEVADLARVVDADVERRRAAADREVGVAELRRHGARDLALRPQVLGDLARHRRAARRAAARGRRGRARTCSRR